jgi:hypothetical protein
VAVARESRSPTTSSSHLKSISSIRGKMFIGLKLSRDYENILLVRTACNYLVRGSEGTVPSISKDLPYKKIRNQSINYVLFWWSPAWPCAPALFRGQTVGSVRACDGGRPQVLPRDTGDQDRWCDRLRFPLPRHVGCCAGPVPPLPRDRYASSTTLRSSRTCVNRSVQRIGVISARIDFCR